MRMLMPQGRVMVPVAVRLARRIIRNMGMLMMDVVRVKVFVIERFV